MLKGVLVKLNKRTVLICDENAKDAEVLQRSLTVEGYNVLLARDGRSAQKMLDERDVDIMVMEARQPDIDGFELCRVIRGVTQMPIIILSSRTDEFDRILGLKIGADDYITKPFSPREVAVRVETVLRRMAHTHDASRSISVGGLTLFPDSYSAYINGEKLELIPSDFKLLCYMAVNAGKVLTREKMLDAVWGFEYFGSQRSVDTQIKRIRAALKDKDVHFAIHSIYGVGYKLEAADKNF